MSLRLRETLRIATRRLGYGLLRTTSASPGPAHEVVVPTATYSPWNLDPLFLAAYERIRRHTLVDKYRCHELWSLVEQSAKTEGALLQVGVWRGGTGALIAARARACGIGDPVYLCDTFRGVVKAGTADPGYRGGEHADTARAVVERLVTELGLGGVEVLEGTFPEETGGRVTAERLRFCHVDVDVYQSGRDVLDWAWERLAPGGIVVLDDYGFRFCDGIVRLVEEERRRPGRVVVHNLNGHALIVKS